MYTSGGITNIQDKVSVLDVTANQSLVKLRYTIAEASSYSGIYEPHNILYDRPHDLTSRWSGAAVASIAPNKSSSSSSVGGQSNPPSSSLQRSSSPLTGVTRDGSVGVASGSNAGPVAIGRNSASGSGAGSASVQFAGEKQFIILKLDKLSILRRIQFGKYHKPHPCNLKDFKVYASQSTKDPRSNAWVRILRGGLRNDSQPEGFDVRWTNSEGIPFPVRYIKLVPLATHSPNFNFSVWHIVLEGTTDRNLVEQVANEYQDHRESTALRLILKHLRSRAYHTAFQTLLQSCTPGPPHDPDRGADSIGNRRPFEHPLVTQLFESLMRGQWDAAEECLEKAAWGEGSSCSEGNELEFGSLMPSQSSRGINAAASLFTSYVGRSMPKAGWTRIMATDNDGDSPCGRGGHEMELDSEKGIIWLYGGWDGSRDLSDLWAYYIHEARWRCISRDVRYQGGPGPRSCHKMVFDPRTGFLYVLGRFIDYDRVPSATTAASSGRSPGLTATSPNLANRDSSPLPPSPANQSSSINRSTTRGFFLPRVTTTQEGAAAASDNAADFMNEAFSSTRGGSTRLLSGRTSFLAVDRAARGSGDMPSSSGANSPNPSSPNPSGHSVTSMTGYESDFYRFSTRSERWDRLSVDTHSEGGPKLIFDHQMIVDPDAQLLYVFGGRVAHPDSSKVELSGMWKYDVIQRSWTFLFDDLTHAQSRITSRVGHTMLLDTYKKGHMAGSKLIWILAGQRNHQYLADMWTYSPTTGAVREISKDYSISDGPEGGFTQRAAIDSTAREIYLFSGLVKKSKNKGEQVKSAFWIYNIERGNWKMVYQYGGLGSLVKSETNGGDETEEVEGSNGDEAIGMDVVEPGGGPIYAFPTLQNDIRSTIQGERTRTFNESSLGALAQQSQFIGFTEEPQPRYAAQLMYDSKQRLFYIFGGNPADALRSSLRLGDLWSLELIRPGIAEVLRKTKFKLRQQRFLEMAHDQHRSSASGVGSDLLGMGMSTGAGWGSMQALVYLQTQVSQVVNHDIAEESQAFRKLMAHLLSPSSSSLLDAAASPGQGSSYSDVAFPSVADPATLSSTVPLTTEEDKEESHAVHSTVASDSDEAGEDEETEMLSISQVLPTKEKLESDFASTGGVTSLLQSGILGSEGKASSLYKQRYQLFKALIKYLPSEAVEPEIDLLDCIDTSKLSF